MKTGNPDLLLEMLEVFLAPNGMRSEHLINLFILTTLKQGKLANAMAVVQAFRTGSGAEIATIARQADHVQVADYIESNWK